MTSVAAQPAPTRAEAAIAAAAVEQTAVPAGSAATLTYANRRIVELRASLLGRLPAERVALARMTLDQILAGGLAGPVVARPVGEAVTIEIGGHFIFAIMPSDIDTLAGETLNDTAALATSRLQAALNEVAELSRPRQVLIAALEVVLATAAFAALFWMLLKVRTGASRRLVDAAERRLRASAVGDVELIRSSRVIELLQGIVGVLAWGLFVFIAYSWLSFSMRRFPYTRPWGESLRAFLLSRLSQAGASILQALPGLFTVLLIVLITRFVLRIVQLFFHAVEDGRITLRWVYPETAQPTRKLLTLTLWLFALAIAYPYLPGSESEAFKGVSVFVGLVVSLGSSGLVNQVMSGFTLTYSRALRTGDFVKVGEIEGTVAQLGTLSTKIRTSKSEDITIPNAVVVSQIVTNYSRFAETDGVFVPTDITIGYDVPWRQVQALLLLAAARTSGVRREPAPLVRHAALEETFIRYTLLVCLERPAHRGKTLAAVHANILDAFNEYGVQITAPRYESDPLMPKFVPRDRWFSSPASPATSPASFAADSTGQPAAPPRE